MKLLLKNIDRLYTPLTQARYGEIETLQQVHLLIEDGQISSILSRDERLPDADQTIDAVGKTLLPGFVDAHTHPVFWKTREDEFILRTQGKSYEEIAAAGGGIRNSVRRFREAGKEQIKAITAKRIARFFEFGATTIEAKSGYGLSTLDELKALEIISELNSEQPLEMIPTFLGAHEVPDEYRADRRAYIDLLINETIPLVAEKKLARFCDVFCEHGVFSVDESREILIAAKKYDLQIRIHADELSAFGAAELAAEMGAASADHLLMVSDQGIRDMASSGVIPVLLPGTAFFLGKNQYAPARKMIEAGCFPAVATDFNPGSSMTQNMQLIWTIAALRLHLLPGELLWATTLTAARSLGIEERVGSIESGKQADLVLLDIPNLNYLPYHYGVNHTWMTIKKGRIVYSQKTDELS
jgi:imidazolonepropionase